MTGDMTAGDTAMSAGKVTDELVRRRLMIGKSSIWP